MILDLVKLVLDNSIPIGAGILGTLVVEHGAKWTVKELKEFYSRNASSLHDDVARVEADIAALKAKLKKSPAAPATTSPTTTENTPATATPETPKAVASETSNS